MSEGRYLFLYEFICVCVEVHVYAEAEGLIEIYYTILKRDQSAFSAFIALMSREVLLFQVTFRLHGNLTLK